MKKIYLCIFVFLFGIAKSQNTQNSNIKKIKFKKETRNLFKLDFSHKLYPSLVSFSNTVFEIIPDSGKFSVDRAEYPWGDVKIENTDRKNEYWFIFSGIPKGKPEKYRIRGKIAKRSPNETLSIFRIIHVPDMQFEFNGKIYYQRFIKELTVDEILKANKLILKIPGSDYKYLDKFVKFQVVSFELSCVGPHRVGLMTYINIGAIFSDEIKNALKNNPSGTTLYFENVRIKDSNDEKKPDYAIPGMVIRK
jgi:hypothetical protein